MLNLQTLGISIALLFAFGNGNFLEDSDDRYPPRHEQFKRGNGNFLEDLDDRYPRQEQFKGATVVLQAKCLKAHNVFRRLHQRTPDLVWNKVLAKAAQEYANQLAKENDGLRHDTARNRANRWGENLYLKDSKRIGTCADAVTSWYDEIDDYDFNSGLSKNGRDIGHFTQVAWRFSRRVGVGIAYADSKKNPGNRVTIVVAKYSRQGNLKGRFTRSVLGLKPNGKRPRFPYQVDRSLCQVDVAGCNWMKRQCSTNRVVRDICIKSCNVCNA